MALSMGDPLLTDDQRRETMKAPEDVAAMLRLKALGWGVKRIAAELGCARNTVRHWLAQGDWCPVASPSRSKKLDGLSDWLRECFFRHGGNADVLRQELAREKAISVSLRTVERAVAPLRRELIAQARATVRFETQPGEQLQIDFGERRVLVGGVKVQVFLFVATLGYSRRLHVRAYGHEKQDSWFDGMESAFGAFGGVPREVLLDNAKALILHHDPASREVVLHPRLRAVSGSHQGQGRARRRLRQVERDRRPQLRQLGGDGGAPGRLDPRGGRCAGARHDRRAAGPALCPRRGGGAASAGRHPAIRHRPRSAAPGGRGLRH
jgi:transposase